MYEIGCRINCVKKTTRACLQWLVSSWKEYEARTWNSYVDEETSMNFSGVKPLGGAIAHE
jgi:hypothetical protein